MPLIGHSRDVDNGGRTTMVTKTREIAKVYPPNVLAQEIDNDHPDRLRALFVDSCNPLKRTRNLYPPHQSHGCYGRH